MLFRSSKITTPRKEDDRVEILSGLLVGTPAQFWLIALLAHASGGSAASSFRRGPDVDTVITAILVARFSGRSIPELDPPYYIQKRTDAVSDLNLAQSDADVLLALEKFKVDNAVH